MTNQVHHVKSRMIAAVFVLLAGISSQAAAKPLKVFILAGQSNMEGPASVKTFNYIADDPATAPMHKEMVGPDGKPKVCDKVWMSYLTGDQNTELCGNLTAGYGSLWGLDPKQPGDKIGPEFTFGIYMSKALNEPILIIKTAWGGKSLNINFRPPSAGKWAPNSYIEGKWKEMGLSVEKETAPKIKESGGFYRLMITHVKTVLADIKRVVPVYDPKQGYELAGFVWFQGFNDMVDSWVYPKGGSPGGYDEYGQLLTMLIRDVRKDLSAPDMPFVIGVMGIAGEHVGQPQANFRQAQLMPTLLPEFKGNVAAVPTAPFWDVKLGALEEKKDRTPDEEALWQRGASNAAYHYLGCAKTFALAGKAFAEATLSLMKPTVGK